ncbi:MAG: glycosyltransferase [Candidatus Nanopelagicales bacterium]
MNSRDQVARLNHAFAHSKLIRRALRIGTRRAISRGKIKPGATIIVVNWNSLPFLQVAVKAIRHFSPDSNVEILVMDNASSDGSKRWLKANGVRAIPLPRNVGHEMALDIGALISRREFIVSLDVDAFPLSNQWLSILLDPLRNRVAEVSGVHVCGGFVHPCCLAMRLDRFVALEHTFMPQRSGQWAETADDPDPKAWDTGWLISLKEPRRNLIERTQVRGPGNIGMVWEPVVYHNFYSTRFGAKIPPSEAEVDVGVTQQAASASWEWATDQFLPPLGTHTKGRH